MGATSDAGKLKMISSSYLGQTSSGVEMEFIPITRRTVGSQFEDSRPKVPVEKLLEHCSFHQHEAA